MEMNMHDSTLDLFDKVGIAHDDIEALATYYEVTCDYYDCLLYTSPSPRDNR